MPAPLPDQSANLTRAGVALVSHRDGTIRPDDASGIYVADRRIVQGLRLEIDGRPVSVLSHARTGPWSDRLVCVPRNDGNDPVVVIVRDRSLARGYEERFTITSADARADVNLTIAIEPGDIDTVTDTRDEAPASGSVGRLLELLDTDGLTIEGTEMRRTVRVAPNHDDTFGWCLAVTPNEPRIPLSPEIACSEPALDRAVERAGWDLDALTVVEPKTQRAFPAARSPHGLAVFGRDGLIASLLSMLNGTERALDALDVLAAHQGVDHDPRTGEEPGRILHELRIGERAEVGLDPGTPSYRSIDATPLFVVVLRECLAWGASPARLRPLLPAARAAVDWSRSHVDDLGFVQSVPDPDRADHENWKTSSGALVRADGSPIEGSAAPVEVQGYVHAALVGLAELEEAIGDPTLAVELRTEADDLAQRFAAAYLTGGSLAVGVAVERPGNVIDLRASNAGHLLATDLIDDRTARKLTNRLLGTDEFSGWGIRTLATSASTYNPLGSHVGSVWPHDTALSLRGLSLRAMPSEARQLIDGLLDLANAFDGQMPEVIAGFSRDQVADPVRHPSAPRTAAWAAAVPFQIVTSLLGMRPNLHRSELRFHPLLADDERITIRGLRMGGRLLDIEAVGKQVTVTGDVRGITIVSPALG